MLSPLSLELCLFSLFWHVTCFALYRDGRHCVQMEREAYCSKQTPFRSCRYPLAQISVFGIYIALFSRETKLIE